MWMPKMLSLNQEKRQYNRVETRNLIREVVDQSTSASSYSTYNLVDISEGGFQFSSPKWVCPRKIFEVDINLAEENKQVRAVVKVVWSRLIRQKKTFCRAGVTFVKIQPQDRQTIREYVRHSLQSSGRIPRDYIETAA